jgi:hypothetical protein
MRNKMAHPAPTPTARTTRYRKMAERPDILAKIKVRKVDPPTVKRSEVEPTATAGRQSV